MNDYFSCFIVTLKPDVHSLMQTHARGSHYDDDDDEWSLLHGTFVHPNPEPCWPYTNFRPKLLNPIWIQVWFRTPWGFSLFRSGDTFLGQLPIYLRGFWFFYSLTTLFMVHKIGRFPRLPHLQWDFPLFVFKWYILAGLWLNWIDMVKSQLIGMKFGRGRCR